MPKKLGHGGQNGGPMQIAAASGEVGDGLQHKANSVMPEVVARCDEMAGSGLKSDQFR